MKKVILTLLFLLTIGLGCNAQTWTCNSYIGGASYTTVIDYYSHTITTYENIPASGATCAQKFKLRDYRLDCSFKMKACQEAIKTASKKEKQKLQKNIDWLFDRFPELFNVKEDGTIEYIALIEKEQNDSIKMKQLREDIDKTLYESRARHEYVKKHIY